MTTSKYTQAAQNLRTTLLEVALPRDDNDRSVYTNIQVIEDLDDPAGGAVLSFDVNGGILAVHVSDFWRYPDTICYFVNWSHKTKEAFRSGMGVNSLAATLVEIGQALQFAYTAGDPPIDVDDSL